MTAKSRILVVVVGLLLTSASCSDSDTSERTTPDDVATTSTSVLTTSTSVATTATTTGATSIEEVGGSVLATGTYEIVKPEIRVEFDLSAVDPSAAGAWVGAAQSPEQPLGVSWKPESVIGAGARSGVFFHQPDIDSIDDLIDELRSYTSLEVLSEPVPTALGGGTGVLVDVLVTGSDTTCQLDPHETPVPCTTVSQLDSVIPAGHRVRLYLVEAESQIQAATIQAPAGHFESFQQMAEELLETVAYSCPDDER